jgi:hypothetical protein
MRIIEVCLCDPQPFRNRKRPALHPAGRILSFSEATTRTRGAPDMRIRIGSTIAVVAAVIGLAGSVAGPLYSAFGV